MKVIITTRAKRPEWLMTRLVLLLIAVALNGCSTNVGSGVNGGGSEDGLGDIVELYSYRIARATETREKQRHLNVGIKQIRRITGDDSVVSATSILQLIDVASVYYDILPEVGALAQAYKTLQSDRNRTDMELGKSAYYLAAAIFSSGNLQEHDSDRIESLSSQALEAFEAQSELPEQWLRKAHDMRAHLFWYQRQGDEFLASCKARAAYGQSGEITDYFPIRRVEPIYPPTAARQRQGGWALVEMDVGPDGIPQNVRTSEASGQTFGNAAVAAVRQWRFIPRCDENGPTTTAGVKTQLVFRIGR